MPDHTVKIDEIVSVAPNNCPVGVKRPAASTGM